MKAKEAPEKIYVSQHSGLHRYKKNDNDDIEYIRTDAFIEKACEWLRNSTYGYMTEKWGEIDLDRETLAVDFANYMKGE